MSTGSPTCEARAQAAAGVGEDDRPAARGGGHADAVHDGLDAAALVEVGAAEEGQHPRALDIE